MKESSDYITITNIWVSLVGGWGVRGGVGGGSGGWGQFEHFLNLLCEASGAPGPMVQGPLGPEGPHLILVGPCSLWFQSFVKYICCIVLPIVLPIVCLLYYLRTPSHQAPHPHLPPRWLRIRGWRCGLVEGLVLRNVGWAKVG